jgi:hypothetical protein
MVIDRGERKEKRKSVINQQQHIKHKVISRAQKKHIIYPQHSLVVVYFVVEYSMNFYS